MKQNGRGNTLLVELLIVVLLFMLASTTLMEIFGAAKQNSNKAGAGSAAILQVQNMTEQLYAADDMPSGLLAMGFEQTEDAWRMDLDGYVLTADYTCEKTAAGALHRTEISAWYGKELLFTLPLDAREKVAALGCIDIIGHVTAAESGAMLVTPDGSEIALRAPGFTPKQQ